MSDAKQNDALHVPWEYCRTRAFRGFGPLFPLGVNLYPWAEALRAWMAQERDSDFPLFTKDHKEAPGSHSNPYTYDASVLVCITSVVINDSHRLARGDEPVDEIDANVARVRIFNEQALYFARVCEVIVKQMLHCTDLPRRSYKLAPMRKLIGTLYTPSRGKQGGEDVLFSPIGSLAHRFKLCGQYEECLRGHLIELGNRRNEVAAHAGTMPLEIHATDESNDRLLKDSVELGNHFFHALEHLAEIESAMLQELEERVPERVTVRFPGPKPRSVDKPTDDGTPSE